MKKFYFLCLFLSSTLFVQAQVQVTFSVDMNAEITAGTFDPAADLMRIGGDFQGWTPTDNQMEDADEDGVYTLTVDLAADQAILYKFVINDWGTNEFGEGAVAGDCNMDDGAGNVNRTHTVVDNNGTDVLPTYIYNTCDLSSVVNVNNLTTITDLTIAPNPASDFININYSNANNTTHDILITSITGQVVKQFYSVAGNNQQVDVKDLSAGMYFVTFRNDKGEQGSEKFIVK